MRIQTGTVAVLALLVVTVLFIRQEGSGTLIPPVFVSTPAQQLYVELCAPYLCRDNSSVIAAGDRLTLRRQIIQNAQSPEAKSLVSRWLELHPLRNGQKLTIQKNGAQQLQVECEFMGAVRQIALGIRLHPDHMTHKDWAALPGVGEKLASAIIAERSVGGDFGSVSALTRVQGISDKKLGLLRPYFQ